MPKHTSTIKYKVIQLATGNTGIINGSETVKSLNHKTPPVNILSTGSLHIFRIAKYVQATKGI